MNLFNILKMMLSRNDPDNRVWNRLTEEAQIDAVLERSVEKPQLIYKHSDRCSICWYTKSELERSAEEISTLAEMYFVDVIASRSVSNKLAEVLGVWHESPQAILVKGGEAVWDTSHGSVKGEKVLGQLK